MCKATFLELSTKCREQTYNLPGHYVSFAYYGRHDRILNFLNDINRSSHTLLERLVFFTQLGKFYLFVPIDCALYSFDLFLPGLNNDTGASAHTLGPRGSRWWSRGWGSAWR